MTIRASKVESVLLTDGIWHPVQAGTFTCINDFTIFTDVNIVTSSVEGFSFQLEGDGRRIRGPLSSVMAVTTS